MIDSQVNINCGARWLAGIFLVLSLTSSLVVRAMQPTIHLAEKLGPIRLESTIPAEFGSWRADNSKGNTVVDPQAEELLKKIYSEVLNRTYVHQDGYRIMLSIAYGDDQTGTLQVHYPDDCYPAQGFFIKSRQKDVLNTKFGKIPVVKLETALGDRRPEPLIYWVTVGTGTVSTAIGKKLAEMSYTLSGNIPDGLLFRISSIDSDSIKAYKRQSEFARDLLASIPKGSLARIAGLSESRNDKH